MVLECKPILFPFIPILTFSQRNDIPSNVKDATSSSEIDTGSWGIPTAAYPSSGCDIEKHFPPQNLILLTTLCGVW